MKRTLFFLIGCILAISSTFSQRKVVVTFSDGTFIEKNAWDIKDISFLPLEAISTSACERVNLGLSVDWASHNLQSDDSIYTLFGWGDNIGVVTAKDLSYYPKPDFQTDIVGKQYDIVHNLWGDKWRLPSKKEFQELIDSCEWQYISNEEEGVQGFNVVSKVNGNSIFLPVTSFRYGEQISQSANDKGFYWTGIIDENDFNKAIAFEFGSESDSVYNTFVEKERYFGFAVRPVYGDYHVGITIQVNNAYNIQKTSANITAIFTGDIAEITSFGLKYANTKNDLSNGNFIIIEKMASDITDNMYSFSITDLQPNETYYYQAYAVINGKDSLSEVLSFTTLPKYSTEFVDLGLKSGLKWATYNLGGDAEGDYGNLYAWGDPQEVSVNQATYQWPNVLDLNDSADIAGTDLDIVFKLLGNDAHLPNKLDWMELVEQCDWKYEVLESGISGYRLTGPNSNTIFLPWNGNRQADGTYYKRGIVGYYWTSNNNGGLEADYFTFSTSPKYSAKIGSTQKYLGMGIRPVSGKSNGSDEEKIDENPSDYDYLAVDLGLSVDWASQNIGAKSESDAGSLFAWGETSTKDYYDMGNYSHYVANSYLDLGENIEKTGYDAAYYNWGGRWKMPNYTEMLELITECTWKWDTINGVGGYRVTGPNEKSIFLPVSGGDNGSYWTSNEYYVSSKDPFYVNSAYFLDFYQREVPNSISYYYRYMGKNIRPVRTKN